MVDAAAVACRCCCLLAGARPRARPPCPNPAAATPAHRCDPRRQAWARSRSGWRRPRSRRARTSRRAWAWRRSRPRAAWPRAWCCRTGGASRPRRSSAAAVGAPGMSALEGTPRRQAPPAPGERPRPVLLVLPSPPSPHQTLPPPAPQHRPSPRSRPLPAARPRGRRELPGAVQRPPRQPAQGRHHHEGARRGACRARGRALQGRGQPQGRPLAHMAQTWTALPGARRAQPPNPTPLRSTWPSRTCRASSASPSASASTTPRRTCCPTRPRWWT
jgi:hypothetical protein